MPLSIIVYDDATNKKGSEAFAQGDGPPRGRELEIADILRFIKTASIHNTVWLTADVHYAAAHYYNPGQGAVPGLRAVLGIRLRPAARRHFRAERTRQHLRSRGEVHQGAGARQAEPAAHGRLQFFGHVKIDGASGQMTVTLRDRADVALWSTTLESRAGGEQR